MIIGKLVFRLFFYLQYYWKAQSNWYIHSPFVFNFLNEVYAALNMTYPEIKSYRNCLKKSGADFSYLENKKTRFSKVNKHYSKTAISHHYGIILLVVCKELKVNSFLELGTSFGVSTAYIYSSNSYIAGTSLDYNIKAIDTTRKLFNEFFPNHRVQFLNDSFDNSLECILQKLKFLDFSFIDGDHQYESTIRYVTTIAPFLSENAAVVIDDIRWSRDMFKAWSELIKLPEFNYTIDFGRIGILFKVNNHSMKQHFYLH